jgi:hypothetical protein
MLISVVSSQAAASFIASAPKCHRGSELGFLAQNRSARCEPTFHG